MSKYYDLLKNAGVSLDKFPAGDSSKDDAGNILRKPLREIKPTPDPRGQQTGESSSLPGIDPTLVSLLEPDSIGADRFKKIRSRILLMGVQRQIRTIMVTSAEPCDGKSLIAANLAVTISKGIDEHVLLVDADLHSPSLHGLFNLHPRGGLRDYLEGRAPLARFLMKTPVNKLTLLPAGEPTPSASELLGAMNMKALVQELRDRYDDRYIIFDSHHPSFGREDSQTPDLENHREHRQGEDPGGGLQRQS